MSKEAVERVMAEVPELTASGFWYPFNYRRLTREERNAKYRERREAMLSPSCIDEFERACGWLSRQKRTKNVNQRSGTSYGLKHVAEKEAGYAENGMFIAAAITCGFKWKRAWDTPNAWLNISRLCRRDRTAQQRTAA